MNGGKHVAKERGITTGRSVRKRIENLIETRPWLVVKALSTMSDADRQSLKWVLAKI